MRIEELRSQTLARGEPFTFEWNGDPVTAYAGETVLAALLASGVRTLRLAGRGEPRGMLCGIGICYDCLVTVGDQPNQRACVTPARPGLKVWSGAALPVGPLERLDR